MAKSDDKKKAQPKEADETNAKANKKVGKKTSKKASERPKPAGVSLVAAFPPPAGPWFIEDRPARTTDAQKNSRLTELLTNEWTNLPIASIRRVESVRRGWEAS